MSDNARIVMGIPDSLKDMVFLLELGDGGGVKILYALTGKYFNIPIKGEGTVPVEKNWLGDQDSNLGKQIQSLLSCH